MKLTSLAIVAGLLISSFAQADTLIACRKRNAFVYTSYTWAQIEKLEDGRLVFLYGNGIDTQMMQVYLEAEVTQVSENEFRTNESSDPSVSAKVQNKKMSFLLKSQGKTVEKKNYECVAVSQNH